MGENIERNSEPGTGPAVTTKARARARELWIQFGWEVLWRVEQEKTKDDSIERFSPKT